MGQFLTLFALLLIQTEGWAGPPAFQGGFSAQVSRPSQFTCKRCGRPLSRCPKCGRFTHPPQMPIRFDRGQSPQQPDASHSVPQGGSPGLARSSVPTPESFAPSQDQDAAPRVQQSQPPLKDIPQAQPLPSQTPPAQIANLDEQRRRSLGPISQGQFANDILMHYKSSTGENMSINGAAIAKVSVGNQCRYAILSVRHGFQDGGALKRNPSFGTGYAPRLFVNGFDLVTESIQDSDQGANGGPDVAFVSAVGSCDAIPDSKIGTLATEPVQPGEALYARKSQFWATPDMIFQDPSGRQISMAQEGGRLISGFATSDEAGYMGFEIQSSGKVQPGDSGGPIYRSDGRIAGFVSHGPGEPPFKKFFFTDTTRLLEWAGMQMVAQGFSGPRFDTLAAR